MSAGLWCFFWPPPDWPAGTPPVVVEPEPERRGAGGGHRKYYTLDNEYWTIRERYLARALRPPLAEPPRPPAAAPVRTSPPRKVAALAAKLDTAVLAARAATTRADLQRTTARVAALAAEIRRIEREQDDDYILQSILPYLLL